MNGDMTPQTAFDTAVTTREAANIHQMPAWFPAAAATTFAAAMTLIGASWLSSGGTGGILGLTGAALIIVDLALFLVLCLRWRHHGIVPRADGGVTPQRRRRSLWMDGTALVVCAAVWAATGRIGWAAIAAGILFGAETWYRLTGWRHR